MKPRRKQSNRVRVMHLWDQQEVNRAIPYLHSVIGSLREHWLEVLNAERRLDRSHKIKTPMKRQQIVEFEAQKEEGERAQTKFEDALNELNRIDVFLLDPVQGLALIPFRKDEDLAWYVFDHFTVPGLIGWRLQTDPLEQCRPLTQLPQDAIVSGPISS